MRPIPVKYYVYAAAANCNGPRGDVYTAIRLYIDLGAKKAPPGPAYLWRWNGFGREHRDEKEVSWRCDHLISVTDPPRAKQYNSPLTKLERKIRSKTSARKANGKEFVRPDKRWRSDRVAGRGRGINRPENTKT
ncbi:hypothetical protein EVAR_26871_1 [Eumeta japonica]|uniref:Uncharacterized protein n=1 Tax=Eumeta variegata TaxID=151549 RepID=A0A4C1VWM9_EUMVA|nr:hypothetical protein EVAR_26871_1 [Eumeta japonica]